MRWTYLDEISVHDSHLESTNTDLCATVDTKGRLDEKEQTFCYVRHNGSKDNSVPRKFVLNPLMNSVTDTFRFLKIHGSVSLLILFFCSIFIPSELTAACVMNDQFQLL